MIKEFHIGIDLGQTNDYTAIAIIEKLTAIDRRGQFSKVSDESEFHLRGLHRFALRKPYPQIVREVSGRLAGSPFSIVKLPNGQLMKTSTPIFLVIDKTGCGAAVFDLFKEDRFLESRVDVIGVSITGGQNVSNDNSGSYNVPKRELILSLVVELQTGNLKIAKSMPEVQNLVAELRDFELRFTAKANETYNAKNGQHDDLVLATALGLWSAKRFDGDIDPTGILSVVTSRRFAMKKIY